MFYYLIKEDFFSFINILMRLIGSAGNPWIKLPCESPTYLVVMGNSSEPPPLFGEFLRVATTFPPPPFHKSPGGSLELRNRAHVPRDSAGSGSRCSHHPCAFSRVRFLSSLFEEFFLGGPFISALLPNAVFSLGVGVLSVAN